MKIVELFSGIGSQAKAFKRLGIEYEILNTCEWNIHAIVAYDRIHKGGKVCPDALNLNKEQLVEKLRQYTLSLDGKVPMADSTMHSMSEEVLRVIYSAILKTNNFVNIMDLQGNQLPPKIDLITYSFPCQDLSNIGALHGYNKGIDRDANNRSGLLWEVERILLQRKEESMDLPKFLLLENVSSLLSERHRKNFEEWQSVLNDLGYFNHIYCLNASDFGLPQNRYRLLMLSVLTNNNNTIEEELTRYFKDHNLEDANYRAQLNIQALELTNALKLDYSNPKYRAEALLCQPNDTPSRRRMWDDNLQITDVNGQVIVNKVATVTTKQDRHPNAGNIYLNFDNGRSAFRYLTPRECFILMGFDEEDYDNVLNNNVLIKKNGYLFTRDKMIRLAGNSIAVNVLVAIFRQVQSIKENIL